MAASHNAQGGGFTRMYTSTPTVSDTPDYTSGDLMGGKITITQAGTANDGRPHRLTDFSGIIQSVIIMDLDARNLDIDVVFFDTDPTNTTFTDNAAFDINDTDLLTVIGVVNVTTWAAFNDNGVGKSVNEGLAFHTGLNGSAIYAALVARGAHNLSTTNALTLRVGILED